MFNANAYLSFLAVGAAHYVISQIVEGLPSPFGTFSPRFRGLSTLNVAIFQPPHFCALAGEPATDLVCWNRRKPNIKIHVFVLIINCDSSNVLKQNLKFVITFWSDKFMY